MIAWWLRINYNDPKAADMTVTEPYLLTPEEAADALSVSRSTVFRLLKSGALSSVQVMGCRRISVADLKSYIDASRVAA